MSIWKRLRRHLIHHKYWLISHTSVACFHLQGHIRGIVTLFQLCLRFYKSYSKKRKPVFLQDKALNCFNHCLGTKSNSTFLQLKFIDSQYFIKGLCVYIASNLFNISANDLHFFLTISQQNLFSQLFLTQLSL